MVFYRKGQFNVPLILLSIFIVSVIIFSFLGGITGVMQVGLNNPNAQPLDKLAIYFVPIVMVLFLVIFAIVGLRSAGMGGG